MNPINEQARARQDAARETDGTFGNQHYPEAAGGTEVLGAPHPATETNRNALENLVGEIRSEYGSDMTLVLSENGYDNGLNLHQLTDESGWHYGLDDEEGLWRSLQPIVITDPNWHHGTAEPVVLDGDRPGWRIDITEAARILG